MVYAELIAQGRAYDSDDAPLSGLSRKGKKHAKPTASNSGGTDDDARPLAKYRKSNQSLSRRVAPSGSALSRKQKTVAEPSKPNADSDSDSAGSLFSGRESSPEVALVAATSARIVEGSKASTVPMKRPSADDAGPSHHRKRQVMEVPMAITGAVGNSTKARLAQRGQQPLVPSPPTPDTRTQPEKLNLSSFSFKKKSATAAIPSPVQNENATVPSLPRRFSNNVQSPVSMGAPTPGDSQAPATLPQPSGEVRRPSIPLPRRGTLRPPAPNDTMAAADQFLSNIMPPEMAAPMHEESTPELPTTPTLPTGPSKAKSLQLPRISKKWRWSGDMFMDVSRDRAERVCGITLHDPTDHLPNGLRFSICLKEDSIRLSPFHELSCLPIFLDACQRVQQFAKLGPRGDEDASVVKEIATYMMKRSCFCYAHLYMEETSAALLMVFPAGHPVAIRYLRVPPASTDDSVLQAALVPWEITAKEFCRAHWKPRETTLGKAPLDSSFISIFDGSGRKVVTQRRYHQALYILGFPKSLYDFMATPNHPYCIWYNPGDIAASSLGYETGLLKEVLSTCASQDIGYKADARVIFVHVGAVAKLHCLPALAERRAKRADLRFVTYGTHPSVPRERWGMRELFPLGGIVTFTPSAIIQGHYRIIKRIKQIAEHPTWECYVLPSVVAMVAKLCCQGLNPLRVYDEGNFVYQDLLTAIEDGSLALLQAPQLNRDPPAHNDPVLLWTRWMIRVAGLDARGILEECLRLAAEQFANTSDADLPMAIEREIERDLLRMQVQPAIMDSYRRFVLFRTKQDVHFAEDSKLGIECTTYGTFDFRDGYFASNDLEKK
ncbi:hypothetical protein BD414DRAFT_435102 [Trametes punicea]|nr:hypothetical protein BD414DRAFT_435102 [Trametes punicea]